MMPVIGDIVNYPLRRDPPLPAPDWIEKYRYGDPPHPKNHNHNKNFDTDMVYENHNHKNFDTDMVYGCLILNIDMILGTQLLYYMALIITTYNSF